VVSAGAQHAVRHIEVPVFDWNFDTVIWHPGFSIAGIGTSLDLDTRLVALSLMSTVPVSGAVFGLDPGLSLDLYVGCNYASPLLAPPGAARLTSGRLDGRWGTISLGGLNPILHPGGPPPDPALGLAVSAQIKVFPAGVDPTMGSPLYEQSWQDEFYNEGTYEAVPEAGGWLPFMLVPCAAALWRRHTRRDD
jgi:hypothetical protein